jgi:hypothetical protein
MRLKVKSEPEWPVERDVAHESEPEWLMEYHDVAPTLLAQAIILQSLLT